MLNSLLTSVKKETERLKESLSSPSSNLSTLFTNINLRGGNNKNIERDSKNNYYHLGIKNLEQYNFTVDTRRTTPSANIKTAKSQPSAIPKSRRKRRDYCSTNKNNYLSLAEEFKQVEEKEVEERNYLCRKTEREEIRRRLADGGGEMGRRPNLHSRLQNSMNMQVCFMNEKASDSESHSDTEAHNKLQSLPPLFQFDTNKAKIPISPSKSTDFFAEQEKLQAEARHALAQAKEIARLQLSQEKACRAQSPVREIVWDSLRKAGMAGILAKDKRRLNRQLLTDMNVTQLQLIVNDLHSQIEKLNESLVSMLLDRDDLHMEQDSMLVDVEDLAKYLAAKFNSPHQSLPVISASQSILGRK